MKTSTLQDAFFQMLMKYFIYSIYHKVWHIVYVPEIAVKTTIVTDTTYWLLGELEVVEYAYEFYYH